MEGFSSYVCFFPWLITIIILFVKIKYRQFTDILSQQPPNL